MPPNTNPEDDLFEAALLRASGPERDAFLENQCRGDLKLRARIEIMLEGHLGAKNFLDTLPMRVETEKQAASFDVTKLEQVGSYIGSYKILQKLGEGGCGFVYLAEQERPVRRRVALKVIKLGMDTRSVIGRFEAEKQALALMDHPNIAKVFDAGATETGRPYFVMELVRGIRISDYCDLNNLPTSQRLSLFIQVCHAIQHAHQKGIIHRDIKPSNILITLHDGVPVPKVIDFGIAKATCEQRLTDKTIFTAFEQFIGTPAYMSPEQAEMSGLDIDTRSDIYSLGVLLYELLTGSTPFDARELLASGVDAMRKTIREKEAVRPSTRFATLQPDELATTAKRRSAEPARLAHELKGDLDWIIMKCLEKDRARRYETANGLAADLKRHLSNEPVIARPPSAAYRLQKAFHRNKLVFTAASVVVAALVIGLGAATLMFSRERVARRDEQQQRRTAESAQEVAQKERDRADTHASKALESEQQARRALYASEMDLAGEALNNDDLNRARQLLTKQIPTPDETNDLRGFEWRHLWQQAQSDELVTLGEHDAAVHGVRFSPNGTLLASSEINGTVKLWDTRTHKLIDTLRDTTLPISDDFDVPTKGLAFSPDGRLIAVGVGRAIVLWDVLSRQHISLTNAHSQTVNYLAFAPGGKILASGADDNFVKLWNVGSPEPSEMVAFPVSSCVLCLAFSFDGKTLAASVCGATIHRWDVSNPETPVEMSPLVAKGGHSSWVLAIAFSPRTNLLVSAGSGGDLIAWDRATDPQGFSHRAVTLPRGSIGMVYDLRFTLDGQTMLSAGSDNNVTLWDLSGLNQSFKLKGHRARLFSIDVSADGRMLASGGDDRMVKLWDISSRWDEKPRMSNGQWMAAVAVSPDGKIVACLSEDRLSLWDAANQQLIAETRTRRTPTVHLVFSPDSKSIAFEDDGDGNGSIHLLKIPSLQEITEFPGGRPQFAANGAELVYFLNRQPSTIQDPLQSKAADETVGIHWRNLRTQEERVWKTELDWVQRLRISRDGQKIAAASGRRVWIWSADTPDHPVQLETPTDDEKLTDYGIWDMALSPDNRWVATASWDSRVLLWNLDNPEQKIPAIQAHSGATWSVAFSSDSRTLASGGDDMTIKLFNLASLQRSATLRGHSGPVSGLVFSQDGTLLVSCSGDGTARTWRAPSFAQIAHAENQAAAQR